MTAEQELKRIAAEAKMWDYVLGKLFEPKREERNEEQDSAELQSSERSEAERR